MARDDAIEGGRLGRAWSALRNFFNAWRTLREQRYRYLEEILGDSAPPPPPTHCTCNHRL